jgi:hypothetical protein
VFTGDFVEELGPTRLFHGMLGKEPVVVAVPAAAGDVAATSVVADRDAVHLFEPASGRSLRRGGPNTSA